MIISHSPPAKPAPASATPKPAPPEPRERRFAALLQTAAPASTSTATGLSNDLAPAYNRSDDQAYATSFEAMPLIAPMSVALTDADTMPTTLGTPSGRAGVQERGQGQGEPGAMLEHIEVDSGNLRPPVTALGTALSGSPAPATPPRSSNSIATPPVAVVEARPARSPAQPIAPFERTEASRAVTRNAPSRAAGEPIVFALGASISVHVHIDGAQPRVTVRGLRMEATDRGEIASRIAKLMRARGYEISEQMIDLEGTGR